MSISQHDMENLNENQRKQVENMKNLYNGTTDQGVRDRAHQQAEKIRAQANYSGGVDGSQYIGLGGASGSAASGTSQTPTPGAASYLTQAQTAQDAALQAKINQGVSNLNSQKTNIHQQADDLARQAYSRKMISLKDAPQNLASAGLAGTGFSESVISGIGNAFQNEMGAVARSKQEQLAAIDRAVADLQSSGDIAAYENAARLAQAGLEQANWERQFGEGVRQFDLGMADSKTRWEAEMAMRNRELDEALAMGQITREQWAIEKRNAEHDYSIKQAYGQKMADLEYNTGLAQLSALQSKNSGGSGGGRTGSSRTSGQSGNQSGGGALSDRAADLANTISYGKLNRNPTLDGEPFSQREIENWIVTALNNRAITDNDFIALMGTYGLDYRKYTN